ncbi:MAG: hydrogenase maturation protease [Candidatus Nanopelagicales bacterium]
MSSTSNGCARPRALVVGLGSVDRGDDAVGPAVARLVAALMGAEVAERRLSRSAREVHVLVHEDPTALVDLMSGWDLVVVVDAMRAGAPTGTVRVLAVGAGADGLPVRTGPTGTHDLGLAGVIALAGALDRLPDRLRVVGVQAASFEPGARLSAAVTHALPAAVDAVLGELSALDRGAADRAAVDRPAGDREAADVR